MKTKLLFLALSCLLLFVVVGCTQPATPPQPGNERLVLTVGDVEYAFRWCPPGTFMMGSPEDEQPGRRNWERQHQVTLSHGFWMLETPVTQEMWESVMGSNPSGISRGNKYPVNNVTWYECQEFVQKLNDILAGTPCAPEGFKFSLPTEAQWEYACRAGTTTAYYFGDTLTLQQANFGAFHTLTPQQANFGMSVDGLSEVGKYPANAWGLFDMHGNVWEWCLDWHGDYPSGAVTDPTGAPHGTDRVRRGGSWDGNAADCRSAYRSRDTPSTRGTYLGFRLALVRAE